MSKSWLARSINYRLLASLFLYPEAQRLSELQAAAVELLECKPYTGFPFASVWEDLLTELRDIHLADHRQLVNEYNRLFMVRPQAPPYETVYVDVDGQLRGKLVAELDEIYRHAGLMVSPDLHELPDHVSVELEFMSFLCMKEAEYCQARNTTRALQYQAMQTAFMRDHIACWFPAFARRLKKAAPDGLYEKLLAATYQFLLYELSFLGLRKKANRANVSEMTYA